MRRNMNSANPSRKGQLIVCPNSGIVRRIIKFKDGIPVTEELTEAEKENLFRHSSKTTKKE